MHVNFLRSQTIRSQFAWLARGREFTPKWTMIHHRDQSNRIFLRVNHRRAPCHDSHNRTICTCRRAAYPEMWGFSSRGNTERFSLVASNMKFARCSRDSECGWKKQRDCAILFIRRDTESLRGSHRTKNSYNLELIFLLKRMNDISPKSYKADFAFIYIFDIFM